MLRIKINFHKLIWFNENIKNICDFRTQQTSKNAFGKKHFSENDFPEIILQRKPFYIETNGI
jgi:hypothetical protein